MKPIVGIFSACVLLGVLGFRELAPADPPKEARDSRGEEQTVRGRRPDRGYGPPKARGELHAEVTGVVAGPPIVEAEPEARKRRELSARTYHLVDFDNLKINREGHHKELEAGASVRAESMPGTQLYPRLTIEQEMEVDGHSRYHDYTVVFGPYDPSGRQRSAYGRVRNPSFYIGEGWAIYWGMYPLGYSSVVCAAGTGTSFIVQTIPGTSKERVILLEGPGVTVTCENEASDPVTIECEDGTSKPCGKGRYLEYDDGCVISPSEIKDVPNDPADEVCAFLVDATSIACTALWPGTAGWDCPR